MNLNKEIIKLNNLVNENVKSNIKTRFISGNYLEELKSLIKSLAPYGKVAFITFSKTHQKYGKAVLNAVNSEGSKLVSLIMPDKVVKSVDYAGLLFNLPEDIRFIFTMDLELCFCATYFASIKKLPFIFIPLSVKVSGAIDSTLYLKNGGITDKINVANDKYVIIDKDQIDNGDLSKAYAHIISKAVALIDYRLYTSVSGGTFNKTAYLLLEKTINDVRKIFSFDTADRKLALLLNGLKIEIVSNMSNAKTFSYSAESFISKLLGDSENSEDLELAFATEILKLYANYFSVKEAFPVMPDYNGRAEKVARLLKISEKEVITAFIKHTQDFYKDKEKYIKAINLLKSDAENLLDVVNKSKSAYFALGGKTDFGKGEIDLNEILKYAGDTPFYFNGMTVLRELGILDAPSFNKTV